MKVILVNTWNGEGYSFANTASIIEVRNGESLNEFMLRQLSKEVARFGNYTVEKSKLCFSYTSLDEYGVDLDSGTIQVFPVMQSSIAYGVLIMCNINECRLLKDENEYNNALALVKKDADPTDFEEDDESPFIPAYKGDLDYQFIKL